MVISEIEGDAILFYMQNELPGLERLLNQARTMFLAFHSHLKRYDRDRICHCGACSTASELTLKIIAHCGEIGFISVREQRKPHGEDVILAHFLLKNSVPQKEYLLLTEKLYGNLKDKDSLELPPWARRAGTAERYERIGEVPFFYFPLNTLIPEIPDPPQPQQPGKIKNPLRGEIEIFRTVYEVYEIISNLDLRLSWNKDIDELDYEHNRVNRAGTRHICLIGDKEMEFQTVKGDFGSNRLVYGESLTNIPMMKKIIVYYIMEPVNDYTKLVIEAHFHPKPLIGRVMVPMLRKKFREMLRSYLPAIKEACERNHRLLTVKPAGKRPS